MKTAIITYDLLSPTPAQSSAVKQALLEIGATDRLGFNIVLAVAGQRGRYPDTTLTLQVSDLHTPEIVAELVKSTITEEGATLSKIFVGFVAPSPYVWNVPTQA